jgi:hypothetical protein
MEAAMMGGTSPIHYLLLLILLGWVTGVLVLLVNRRTRAIGLIMLIASAALPFILVVTPVAFSFLSIRPPPPPSRPAGIAHHMDTEDRTPHAVSLGSAKNIAENPMVESAKARPTWVGASPGLVRDVYQMSIMVGPYTTRQECDAHLDEALQEALDRYVETCLGERPTERIALSPEVLRRQLVKEQWEEVGQYSVGPMTQLHVLLQFDRRMKDRVLEAHQRGIVAGRLWNAGIGLAAVLAVLTGAWGYLKITGRRMTNLE